MYMYALWLHVQCTCIGVDIYFLFLAASFFKSNPAAVHRLLPWLSRDIKAILGEEHVEFMIQLILSIIDK